MIKTKKAREGINMLLILILSIFVIVIVAGSIIKADVPGWFKNIFPDLSNWISGGGDGGNGEEEKGLTYNNPIEFKGLKPANPEETIGFVKYRYSSKFGWEVIVNNEITNIRNVENSVYSSEIKQISKFLISKNEIDGIGFFKEFEGVEGIEVKIPEVDFGISENYQKIGRVRIIHPGYEEGRVIFSKLNNENYVYGDTYEDSGLHIKTDNKIYITSTKEISVGYVDEDNIIKIIPYYLNVESYKPSNPRYKEDGFDKIKEQAGFMKLINKAKIIVGDIYIIK